jgi:phosphate starvation-inducible PhoH-like protein
MLRALCRIALQFDRTSPNRVVALTTSVTLEPNDSRRLASLCGPFDQNLKFIERRMVCASATEATSFSLSGPAQRVEASEALLKALYEDIVDGTPLESEAIHLYLQDSGVEALIQGGVGRRRSADPHTP